MVSVTHTSGELRDHLIHRLTSRNRLVGVLRVIVPLIGALLLVALIGQIWLANLARQYGIAGISIDRGHLVVETPQYTATLANGGRYVVSANQARAPIDKPDLIELSKATLDYLPPEGAAIFASADIALLDSGGQTVDVPGLMTVEGEDGLHGTLNVVHAALDSQLTTADGAVAITLADGTTIDAANMVFDGKSQTWTFGDATVVIPDLPKPED